jgi:hypothetical protein
VTRRTSACGAPKNNSLGIDPSGGWRQRFSEDVPGLLQHDRLRDGLRRCRRGAYLRRGTRVTGRRASRSSGMTALLKGERAAAGVPNAGRLPGTGGRFLASCLAMTSHSILSASLGTPPLKGSAPSGSAAPWNARQVVDLTSGRV